MTSEKTERNCGNCACAQLVKHPENINQTQLFCRRNPPFIMSQQVRTQAGVGVAQGLSQQPTAAEFVCFDGWRPKYVEPGVPSSVWYPILRGNIVERVADHVGDAVK